MPFLVISFSGPRSYGPFIYFHPYPYFLGFTAAREMYLDSLTPLIISSASGKEIFGKTMHPLWGTRIRIFLDLLDLQHIGDFTFSLN